jgi:pimeloyl-ACP methyl ester carboxylesterase
VLAYRHARAMLHYTAGNDHTAKPEALDIRQTVRVLFSGIDLPRPVGRAAPADLAGGCRRLAIPGSNGVTLVAWHVSRGPDRPLVILFHGYGADKTDLLPEARAFLDLGASVLLVDFRGSGESSEAYTTIGLREAEDVAAVTHYARVHLAHSALVLFGQSMGAAAVLRAVAVHGTRADGVIVEAVFDTMRQTVRNRFHAMRVPAFPSAELLVFWGGVQAGFNGFAHNPVDYAKHLRCPVLFLHGAADPRATVVEGRRVFAAAPGPKTFEEFPSVGHESVLARFPSEWKQAVAKFMSAKSAP